MGALQPLVAEHATIVRAEPERTWDAFVTGVSDWFTSEAVVEPETGGRLSWHWEGWGADRTITSHTGTVLEAVRPDRIVWMWPWDAGFGTTVEVSFRADPEGTVVRVRESGWPEHAEGRRLALASAAGWGEALSMLKVWVEHGIRY